jgi:hypothetical protein
MCVDLRGLEVLEHGRMTGDGGLRRSSRIFGSVVATIDGAIVNVALRSDSRESS